MTLLPDEKARLYPTAHPDEEIVRTSLDFVPSPRELTLDGYT